MNTPLAAFVMPGLGLAASVFSFCLLIYWIILGWRVMRALENAASSLDSISRHLRLRDEKP
ncbi:MAG: hypothetical protein ABI680_12265 [Chthoniobacteraceae bacterium]